MTTTEQFKKIASYQSDNFKEHFGNMPFQEGEVLTSKKLPRHMNDKGILSELKPAEVSLGDVYATLEKLDHDVWAIFYCRDSENTLWAVFACWYDGGWRLHAYSVEDPDDWDAGYQVFSRGFSDTHAPVTLSSFDHLSLDPDTLNQWIERNEKAIELNREVISRAELEIAFAEKILPIIKSLRK